MKNRCLLYSKGVVLFVLMLVLMAVPAMADTEYTFSFATSGGLTAGSGIFDISSLGVIDGVSGTLTASDLGNTGSMTILAPGAFASNDNVWTGSPTYISENGVSFVAGGTDYNVYYFASGADPNGNPYEPTSCTLLGLCITANTYGQPSEQIASGDFTLSAVPDSGSSLMLLGFGLLGMAGFAHRKFLKA